MFSINDIFKSLNWFDICARALQSRRERALELKDESDIRDLLYVALKPLIDDLEREPQIRSVGGMGGRPDLNSASYGVFRNPSPRRL